MARDLLGKLLWHRGEERTLVGRIVEAEAYLGAADPAAHSYRGPTARNRVMFGPAGHAYVYFIYGVHHCLNAVTGPEGTGEAVLIRAVEPPPEPVPGANALPERLRGPGLLCRAYGIDLRMNGWDLTASDLRILEAPPVSPSCVLVGPRVGLTKAADLPLRFRLAAGG